MTDSIENARVCLSVRQVNTYLTQIADWKLSLRSSGRRGLGIK